jgi:hypothetical protein
MDENNGGQLAKAFEIQSPLALRLRNAALSCRMAEEAQPIDTEDLKSRIRELRRFL